MEKDDTIQLVPESAANILKLVREKTDLERFWSGLKVSCLFVALVSITVVICLILLLFTLL